MEVKGVAELRTGSEIFMTQSSSLAASECGELSHAMEVGDWSGDILESDKISLDSEL